ncbi:hypothetical protein OE88DRAFT_1648870 [Heliocybe sulcata]|uniref:Uncharacterized protein n=1 Tax=Heliocybe sulcata TaxID=5364 RepID=A0A5C3MKP8_9AGAM|nr:hypothetical protein OE88DRAFT_1648870 [Heliocybe sulcata]
MSASAAPTTASIRATIERVALDVLNGKFSESAAQHVLLELLPTAEDVVLRSALRYDFADQCWLSLPTSLVLAMREALPDLPWARVAEPRIRKTKPIQDAEEEEQEVERDEEEEEEEDATEAETEVADAEAAREQPVAGGSSASSRRLMEKAGPANDAPVPTLCAIRCSGASSLSASALAAHRSGAVQRRSDTSAIADGLVLGRLSHFESFPRVNGYPSGTACYECWCLRKKCSLSTGASRPAPRRRQVAAPASPATTPRAKQPRRSTRTKEASERDAAKAAADARRLQMLPDTPSHNPSDPSPALPPTSPASSRHTDKSADPTKKSTGKRAAPEPGDAPAPKMPRLELPPPAHPLVGSRVFDPLDASRVVGLISPIPATPATPIDPLPAAVVERLGRDEERLGTLEYYFNIHHAWIQQFATLLTEMKERVDGLQQTNDSLREELRQTREASARTAEQGTSSNLPRFCKSPLTLLIDRSVVERYHQEFVAFRERVDAALGKPGDAGEPSSALVVPNVGAKGADPLFLPESDSDAESDVDDAAATKKADLVDSEAKSSSSEASSSASASGDESGVDAEGAGLVRVKGKESALQAMQRREAERREEEKRVAAEREAEERREEERRAAERRKAKGKGKARIWQRA